MNDSGLNRLIAARLVNGLFGNEYCLALTTTFQPGDLAQFILAFGSSPPLSMEVLNKRLSQPLLIASKYSPKQVLPRLMACISKAETWGGAIPPYMEEIIQHIKGQREDNPLDDKTAEKLLLKLKKTATRALGASKLRFLKQQFTPQEVELFRLIKKADTPKLLEWVETHEVSVELLNNR